MGVLSLKDLGNGMDSHKVRCCEQAAIYTIRRSSQINEIIDPLTYGNIEVKSLLLLREINTNTAHFRVIGITMQCITLTYSTI